MWKNSAIVDVEYVKNARCCKRRQRKRKMSIGIQRLSSWENMVGAWVASYLTGFTLEPSMKPKDSVSLLRAMGVSSWETGTVTVLHRSRWLPCSTTFFQWVLGVPDFLSLSIRLPASACLGCSSQGCHPSFCSHSCWPEVLRAQTLEQARKWKVWNRLARKLRVHPRSPPVWWTLYKADLK